MNPGGNTRAGDIYATLSGPRRPSPYDTSMLYGIVTEEQARESRIDSARSLYLAGKITVDDFLDRVDAA